MMPSRTHPAETLKGEVGDAIAFLKELRNLAGHPGRAVATGGIDFEDDELMEQAYRLVDGIALAVFSKLAERVEAIPTTCEIGADQR